jgi:hypothetical protein
MQTSISQESCLLGYNAVILKVNRHFRGTYRHQLWPLWLPVCSKPFLRVPASLCSFCTFLSTTMCLLPMHTASVPSSLVCPPHSYFCLPHVPRSALVGHFRAIASYPYLVPCWFTVFCESQRKVASCFSVLWVSQWEMLSCHVVPSCFPV